MPRLAIGRRISYPISWRTSRICRKMFVFSQSVVEFYILPGWTKDLWLPHQKPQLAASPTAGSSRMEASADWPSLQKRGFLVVKRFLSAEQCAELAEHYNL